MSENIVIDQSGNMIDTTTGEMVQESEQEHADPAQLSKYEVDITSGKVTSDIFTKTESGLNDLREKYPSTLDPHADYEIINAGQKEVRGLRTELEKERKRIKRPFIDGGRIVDEVAGKVDQALEDILTPLLEKKKIVDDAKDIAEAKRLADLDAKAAAILLIATRAEHGTLEEISAALEQVNSIDTLNGFYERQRVACENKAAAVATLNAALLRRNEQDKRDREAEQARQALAVAQAELAKQQAEAEAERLAQAEILRKQQEAQEAELAAQAEELRKEREELAKLRAEAEQRKREEQARIDAEAEAKLQAEIAARRKAEEAERLERQLIAREEAERIAAEKAAAELAASEAEQVRRKRNKKDAAKLSDLCEYFIGRTLEQEPEIESNRAAYQALADAIKSTLDEQLKQMVGE